MENMAVNVKFYTNPLIGFRIASLLMFFSVLMEPVHAQVLPKPTGPVLLTVSGLISQHNGPNVAEFDLAMLDALPASQIVTKTPWHSAPAKFSGPALKALLSSVGSRGKSFRLTAQDRYEASIPIEDIESFGPILALRMDGKNLSVRSRGPVLLMYPFDSYSQIDTDIYYGRSVWQLIHIVVE
jgi:hypothetical protein